MKKTNLALLNSIKDQIINDIDQQRNNLIELSLKIHSNPELGFEEKRASLWLCNYLSKYGFTIKKGIAGLSTAFKASYGRGKPRIAVLAEYDALPEAGHACGHNIIAASTVGAGAASRILLNKYKGTVIVYGTPAEEIFGGKINIIEAGEFEDIDVAMIVHPGTRTMVTIEALACIGIDVEFFGKAAHAAAHPEMGVNALDAMILAFNNINALRQHIDEKARIHGIITHGGNVANIIPEYTAGAFLIRAVNLDALEDIKKKVLNCFKGAATATGCKFKYKQSEQIYDSMKNNMVLASLFKENLLKLGRQVLLWDSNFGLGSTDMGNVSHIVPAIHPSIEIAEPGVHTHSPEFAVAAASNAGHDGLIDAAKAMAMTVVDIIGKPEIIKKIKTEFNK